MLALAEGITTGTLAALRQNSWIDYIARLTRSGMLEVMRSDYIRTARAKGLSERAVVMRGTDDEN